MLTKFEIKKSNINRKKNRYQHLYEFKILLNIVALYVLVLLLPLLSFLLKSLVWLPLFVNFLMEELAYKPVFNFIS